MSIYLWTWTCISRNIQIQTGLSGLRTKLPYGSDLKQKLNPQLYCAKALSHVFILSLRQHFVFVIDTDIAVILGEPTLQHDHRDLVSYIIKNTIWSILCVVFAARVLLGGSEINCFFNIDMRKCWFIIVCPHLE